jgi:hypothetical protein
MDFTCLFRQYNFILKLKIAYNKIFLLAIKRKNVIYSLAADFIYLECFDFKFFLKMALNFYVTPTRIYRHIC